MVLCSIEGLCVIRLVQCVTKVMEQLATEGKLVEKVYGKQKVYVVNQVSSFI